MGIARTLDKTRVRFYWPTMNKDVVNWVKSCKECSRKKNPVKPIRAQLIPMPVPSFPFERIGTDILGPLPRCKGSANRYVLVFVDFFTKYVELVAIPDMTAETVAWAFVKEVVCRHTATQTTTSNVDRQC